MVVAVSLGTSAGAVGGGAADALEGWLALATAVEPASRLTPAGLVGGKAGRRDKA